MTDADTRVVEQTLRINARPETVWRYWTDPAAHVRLVGRGGRARPPARRRLCGRDGRRGRSCVGEYVELVPHERIVFTFGWDPHARRAGHRARLDAGRGHPHRRRRRHHPRPAPHRPAPGRSPTSTAPAGATSSRS